MADVTPILIKDLAAQTSLQDTDYFIVGGADAKKITVAQMKEALGINELNTKIAKVNYARTIAVSANTQNYISFSITVPDGYEILSANISAQHNTILIGQAIVSGNALYFPYISTTSYSSEIFTLDVFFIKL